MTFRMEVAMGAILSAGCLLTRHSIYMEPAPMADQAERV